MPCQCLECELLNEQRQIQDRLSQVWLIDRELGKLSRQRDNLIGELIELVRNDRSCASRVFISGYQAERPPCVVLPAAYGCASTRVRARDCRDLD
jgi:hypothetical protein